MSDKRPQIKLELIDAAEFHNAAYIGYFSHLHADEIDPSFTYHEPGEDVCDFSKPRPFRPELYLLKGLTGFKQ
jgi:hypothetical protein